MNTLPALPPVVYLAGRYMTSLDMFMAKVRDVLSSTRRNALIEQEHLLALYRDGVLLAWLRTLSSTDHRAASMHKSLSDHMKMQSTDTEAKKYIAKLFGSEVQPVSSLKFSEYVELLPEFRVSKDMQVKSVTHNMDDIIDVQDVEQGFILLRLSFRIIKAANDFVPITLGEDTVNIDLRTKGKVVSGMFHVILSDEIDFTANLTDGHSVIHTFSFERGWVDLGFGTKWATCNIGAKRPEEIGNYFAWGDIRVRNVFDPDNYQIVNIPNISGTKYDCATSMKGPKWRIPLKRDWNRLMSKCNGEMVNIGNVCGIRLVSRINGKSIFLPCGGYMNYKNVKEPKRLYYWSAIQDNYNTMDAFIQNGEYCNKWKGLPVRPIYIG